MDALVAAAEPPATSAQRRRFDASKQLAHCALARLKTFDEWRDTQTAAQASKTVAVFGSLEAFYAKTIATLRQRAVFPLPTEIRVREDGSQELRW